MSNLDPSSISQPPKFLILSSPRTNTGLYWLEIPVNKLVVIFVWTALHVTWLSLDQTHTRKHTQIKHAHTNTRTCIHTHANTHAHAYTHTYTHTHANTHTHTNTHTQTHTHTYKHTHTHTYKHTHTHTHTNTHTHIETHIHIETHTHTHTHTHIQTHTHHMYHAYWFICHCTISGLLVWLCCRCCPVRVVKLVFLPLSQGRTEVLTGSAEYVPLGYCWDNEGQFDNKWWCMLVIEIRIGRWSGIY